MTRAGLHTGDVILLLLPNHLKTCLPIYVGAINGYSVIPVDCYSRRREVEFYIRLSQPKMIFCIKENSSMVKEVLHDNNIEAKMIIIDDNNNDIDAFIGEYNITNEDVNLFKPHTFELSTEALLIPTSGSTGQPKIAVITHENLLFSIAFFFHYFKQCPFPTRLCFLMSPIQWISSLMQHYGSVIYSFTRIQSVVPVTPKTCQDVFLKYKPTFLISSPPLLTQLHYSGHVDFSSLDDVLIGGSIVSETLKNDFKARYPNVRFMCLYGMTELFSMCFQTCPNGPGTNIGKEFCVGYKYRIVDPTNGQIINKANMAGELWIKSNSRFQGYYRNSEDTAVLFSEDGYLKTGDIIYKDEEGYYFFVERLKMLFKYKGVYLYPAEVEEVLRKHPSVEEVAVTAVPDGNGIDLPAALVVTKPDCCVTAQELYDLVAQELSNGKQLRGGIYFIKSLPFTPNQKIDKTKVRTTAIEYFNKKDVLIE